MAILKARSSDDWKATNLAMTTVENLAMHAADDLVVPKVGQ
jgi:hypothetical protein